MAKVLNIKEEKDKKELKDLLKQVDVSSWDNEPEDSPFSQFIKEREAFKQDFIRKHNISSDDEVILYAVCDELKKRNLKKVDMELCELASLASDTIIKPAVKGEECIKNDFFKKRNDFWNKYENEKKYYKFLIKNSNYWITEIQTALKTKNYNLLMNNMSVVMDFSSFNWRICEGNM